MTTRQSHQYVVLAVSVAAEEEARPQREAGVCVKVPGFCVVRTHSQVLSSNGHDVISTRESSVQSLRKDFSNSLCQDQRLTRVWDYPMTVSPVLGDSFAL